MKKIYLASLFLSIAVFALAVSCGRQFSVSPAVSQATPTSTPYRGCLSFVNLEGTSYSFSGIGTATVTPVISPIPTQSGPVPPVPIATYIPYTSTSACGGTILRNLAEWQSYWTILNLPIPEPPTDFSSRMVFLFQPSFFTNINLDGICYDDSRLSIYTTTYSFYVSYSYMSICLFCPTTYNAYLIPRSDLLPECNNRYYGYGCVTCATPQ